MKLTFNNIKSYTNDWQKARGLMFSKKKDLLFVFSKPKRIALHNFFVFFRIDLIFLDSNFKVIEKKMNFKPFRLYTSKTKANYVIEISTLKNRKKASLLNIGDSVKIA